MEVVNNFLWISCMSITSWYNSVSSGHMDTVEIGHHRLCPVESNITNHSVGSHIVVGAGVIRVRWWRKFQGYVVICNVHTSDSIAWVYHASLMTCKLFIWVCALLVALTVTGMGLCSINCCFLLSKCDKHPLSIQVSPYCTYQCKGINQHNFVN